ncbi:unnamed protein product [Gongylonema pulchrum]|uniref:Uncharacterized protein n=1 Tax=Gongylonema pulchrum TaxID=637853 RepID=A0A183E4R2_9BILA|nr:unnamed protein product [Gongylonema pulchrum]
MSASREAIRFEHRDEARRTGSQKVTTEWTSDRRIRRRGTQIKRAFSTSPKCQDDQEQLQQVTQCWLEQTWAVACDAPIWGNATVP